LMPQVQRVFEIHFCGSILLVVYHANQELMASVFASVSVTPKESVVLSELSGRHIINK
jgi:hypothetical protein